ncbi:GNAT family N-acetyltransferase [Janthinobacterium sp.]|uniref:GNAT family N-acetyltransferase n=1 Tax=Janthinobacterium sp. TaxID=1871054 RepID=UPI002614D8F3|nr:GNAT family N-acetyltransferase [Janthinobacterium sp.]
MHAPAISYRVNTTDQQLIETHLRTCDMQFMFLSDDHDGLHAYAEKLSSRALRCEAWAAHKLIGLIAIYCNDHNTRIAFISSVSVLPDWYSRGIATQLLARAIEEARLAGMHEVRLEVDQDNTSAIALYYKAGFSKVSATAQSIYMQRCINI